MDNDIAKSSRAFEKTSTIKDVAQRAGVSVATVSRVLNNHSRVDPVLCERVQSAVRELGFLRNALASALVRQSSGSIGLILPNMVTFFVPFINEVERIVQAQGKSLIITTRLYHNDEIGNAINFLKQRCCGSIILHPGSISHDFVLSLLREEPHLVLINRWYREYQERCVMVDNRLGARIATRYLIDHGHRDIAVISGPMKNPECVERMEAFRETMKQAHLEVYPELVIEGDYGAVSGERCMAKLLQSSRPFSAVFCLSDEMAVGAIRHLRSIGKPLPGALSIVGFDDIVYADYLYPRLTTVRQPLEMMGRLAAQRALALDGGSRLSEELTLIRPELIERDSVCDVGIPTQRKSTVTEKLATTHK